MPSKGGRHLGEEHFAALRVRGDCTVDFMWKRGKLVPCAFFVRFVGVKFLRIICLIVVIFLVYYMLT